MTKQQTQPKLRMTSQRQLILELVRAAQMHCTADEIYQEVRRRLPRISLGTVYRNLDTLVEQGLVKKIGPIETQRRFDGNTRPHHHVKCVSCGSVSDVPLLEIPGAKDFLEKSTDYAYAGYDLEFLGFCSECRSENTGSSGTENQ